MNKILIKTIACILGFTAVNALGGQTPGIMFTNSAGGDYCMQAWPINPKTGAGSALFLASGQTKMISYANLNAQAGDQISISISEFHGGTGCPSNGETIDLDGSYSLTVNKDASGSSKLLLCSMGNCNRISFSPYQSTIYPSYTLYPPNG